MNDQKASTPRDALGVTIFSRYPAGIGMVFGLYRGPIGGIRLSFSGGFGGIKILPPKILLGLFFMLFEVAQHDLEPLTARFDLFETGVELCQHGGAIGVAF